MKVHPGKMVFGLTSLIALGCGVSEPDRAPATVEISADADSLFFGDSARPVHLTAVVRGARGSILADHTVSWSAGPFNIERTGSRTATLSWNPSFLPVVPSPVEVVAVFDTLTARRTIIACGTAAIHLKNSGMLLRGRSASLDGVVMSVINVYSRPMDVPIRWQSSNQAVVSLQNGTATALQTGTTILSASACGVTDALSIAVVNSGYAVTPILPPGATSSSGVDLNEAGQVVGVSSASGAYRNFLWDAGSFVDLGACQPLAIALNSAVLCAGGGPTIWQNGTAVMRDTLSSLAADMNDLGHVLGHSSVRGAYLWRAPGDYTEISALTRSASRINDEDEIAGSVLTTYGYAALWSKGSMLALANVGRLSTAVAVNDSGDAVGNGEAYPSLVLMALLWRAANRPNYETLRGRTGYLYNDIAKSARDINSQRQVVGEGSRDAFVWAGGRLTLLSSVADTDWTITAAIRINDRGQILGQGSNHRTGYVGAVLLDPP